MSLASAFVGGTNFLDFQLRGPHVQNKRCFPGIMRDTFTVTKKFKILNTLIIPTDIYIE